MPFRYPVSLELNERPCIVVGGGELAEHKTAGLLQAGAAVTVISPSLTGGLEELVASEQVKAIRRPYRSGDLEGAFLAIAATDDRATNAEIHQEAEERRVLLNSVDDIEHCHFAAPSIVRHGDFMLTISTGGKSPALAKRLRRQLSEQFGAEYGSLVDLLGEVRERALPARTVDFDTWADRWQTALERDLLELIRQGRSDEAKDAFLKDLSDPAAIDIPAPRNGGLRRAVPGQVWLVGAGPGDPGLITVRGKAALEAADVVVCDRLVNPALTVGKETIYVGKEPGSHRFPQEEINDLLIQLAREGNNVVRLKGGDPFVFGRGSEEAEALVEAGIEFDIIGAPTSAIAALTAAGIPVTDRRYASSVAFIAGHCGEKEVRWGKLAGAVDTIVILMGISNLPGIVEKLLKAGKDPATPAAIVENGTLASQRVVVASLAQLPAVASKASVKAPAIIVIGEVVRLRDRLRHSLERVKSTQS